MSNETISRDRATVRIIPLMNANGGVIELRIERRSLLLTSIFKKALGACWNLVCTKPS